MSRKGSFKTGVRERDLWRGAGVLVSLVTIMTLAYFVKSGKYTLWRSRAMFKAEVQSWNGGTLNEISFFRTNFAIEEQGVYSRSNHTPMGLFDPTGNKTYIVYGGGQYDGKEFN